MHFYQVPCLNFFYWIQFGSSLEALSRVNGFIYIACKQTEESIMFYSNNSELHSGLLTNTKHIDYEVMPKTDKFQHTLAFTKRRYKQHTQNFIPCLLATNYNNYTVCKTINFRTNLYAFLFYSIFPLITFCGIFHQEINLHVDGLYLNLTICSSTSLVTSHIGAVFLNLKCDALRCFDILASTTRTACVACLCN